jgi:hypothetical protein
MRASSLRKGVLRPSVNFVTSTAVHTSRWKCTAGVRPACRTQPPCDQAAPNQKRLVIKAGAPLIFHSETGVLERLILWYTLTGWPWPPPLSVISVKPSAAPWRMNSLGSSARPSSCAQLVFHIHPRFLAARRALSGPGRC